MSDGRAPGPDRAARHARPGDGICRCHAHAHNAELAATGTTSLPTHRR